MFVSRQKSSAAMSSVMDSSGKMGGATRDGQVALRQQLVENEKRLTESKLQFLSSAHQIDQMKDEMATLKVISVIGIRFLSVFPIINKKKILCTKN